MHKDGCVVKEEKKNETHQIDRIGPVCGHRFGVY